MKKAYLTALTARILTVSDEVATLRLKMGNSFEVNGGFHNSLAAYAQSKVPGLRLWVRAQSPRLAEVYGIAGDLNTLGLSVTSNRALTPAEKRIVENAFDFYIKNVSVHRTLKTDSTARLELRQRTKFHKEGKEYSVAGITKFVIAF